ncbi:cupin domain-containing protein [Cupriavidus pauculus]|uniref:(R)-mandelonitrile lyase n=1 Tax=Cupriavidus pauculus TaxID=82633 RepID=UPI003857F36B
MYPSHPSQTSDQPLCLLSGGNDIATTPAARPEITVTRAAVQPSMAGAAASFTGSVRIDAHFQAPLPARIGGATVTFAPGARTAWHSHPLGQTLLVVAGTGFVQQWGDLVQPLQPGDIVWIPPNTKHWHGATAHSSMVHIALAETLEGKAVDWMEHVDDEQYCSAGQRQA